MGWVVCPINDGGRQLGWFRSKRRSAGVIYHSPVTTKAGRLPLGERLHQVVWRWRMRRQLGPLFEEIEKQVPAPGPPKVLPFYSPAAAGDVEGILVPGSGVGAYVPEGFEAYAWLPNPAWKWVPPGSDGALSNARAPDADLWAKPVTWSEVARANGLPMDRNTRWHEISGPRTSHGHRALSPDQAWTWAPGEGTIEPFAVHTLYELLSRWTGRDDRCLAGKWEGAGGGWETKVHLVTPHWTYHVWACAFGDLMDWLGQPDSFEREQDLPHVIWPESREWFFACLYSGCWSYLAGSLQLIGAVVASDLEAHEVELSDHPH